MNTTGALLLGLAGGFVLAALVMSRGDCCAVIEGAARDKALEYLGPSAVAFGDLVGAWKLAPGLARLAL